jgi:hypothetical protein
MKDILQWIPNFFKGMLEVLERVQNMARGRIRGHIIFWTAMILFFVFAVFFLMWWSKSVYDNFSAFLGHFNIHITQVQINIPSSFFINLLLGLLVAIFDLIVLTVLAGIVGAFFGMLTSILFPAFTTYRIDKFFVELIPLLKRTDELSHTEETKQTLREAKELNRRWQKRLSNRITRFLTTKWNREKFDNMEL